MKGLKLNIKAAERVGKEINQSIIDTNKINDEVKAQCNHIFGNIYLTSYKKAQDKDYLKNNDFTHIVNCALSSKSFIPVYFDEFQYLNLDLKDEPGFDLLSVLYKFIQYIEQISSESANNRILVHCYEGISRGPALIISYLMWKNKWNFDTANSFVKSKRQCVDINIGFCSQLNQWNKMLNLNKDEKLYQINDTIENTNDVKILNKSEVRTEDLVNSSAIFFFKNDIIHSLVLRKNKINTAQYKTIIESINNFEGCNNKNHINIDFDKEKPFRVNLEDMFNTCF